MPLNTLSRAKTIDSSPAGAHKGGEGGDWKYPEFGLGTSAVGLGVRIQEKNYSGPGSKNTQTHSGHNTQRIFDPPSPSPLKWVPRYRGLGSKSKSSLEDHFLSQNEDFTKGQTSDTTTWGMLRERPKKGGVYNAGACAPTTSLRGDFS